MPMPAPNQLRRRALLDAAIELIAAEGIHGLTHRALDRQAGEPVGTASNYFPSRTELIVATAERLVELQQADFDDDETPGRTLGVAADSIAHSLLRAATTDRTRWCAVFELQNEMRRRPEIAAAFAPLRGRSQDATAGLHRRRRMPIPPEAVPVLQALYGGALQALLALPRDEVTIERALQYARTMIFGVRALRDVRTIERRS
jgi:AcrR family transcriptional regulator